MPFKKKTVKRRRVAGVKAKPAKRRKSASAVEAKGEKHIREIERLERKLIKADTKEKKILLKLLINKEHDKLDAHLKTLK